MAGFELALQSEHPASGSCYLLLALAARGDRPHRFDAIAAQRVDAVVEVDGRIAVRRDELDAIADACTSRDACDTSSRPCSSPAQP